MAGAGRGRRGGVRYDPWSRYYSYEELDRGYNLVLYETDGEYLAVIDIANGDNKDELLAKTKKKHHFFELKELKVETAH